MWWAKINHFLQAMNRQNGECCISYCFTYSNSHSSLSFNFRRIRRDQSDWFSNEPVAFLLFWIFASVMLMILNQTSKRYLCKKSWTVLCHVGALPHVSMTSFRCGSAFSIFCVSCLSCYIKKQKAKTTDKEIIIKPKKEKQNICRRRLHKAHKLYYNNTSVQYVMNMRNHWRTIERTAANSINKTRNELIVERHWISSIQSNLNAEQTWGWLYWNK